MSISFVNANADIACGFMAENGTIFNGNLFDDYLPVLQEMEFKASSEIKFIHNNDVCLNIDTYDEHATNKKLNQAIKKNKKLDVTTNDINVGATELVLNFTDMKLVVYNKYNIPHLLCPLDNEILKSKYKGKVVFLTIHRLNNPNLVSDVYGNNKNYLTALKESTKFKKNINHKYDEFNKVVEFAEKCWNETDYLSNDYRCNSIKIITVFQIDESKFLDDSQTTFTSLVILNKNLLITRDNMFNYKENPNNNNDVDLSQFKNDIMPGTKFTYIIDNDDVLSDRYLNQFGNTIKIPKFKSKRQQINGLYVLSVQDNFTLMVDKHYKIEEIDTANFVYKTQEEAEQGADKSTLFAQEIKEKELNMQHTILQAKENYEVKTHQLKKENEELKAEHERKSKENELRFAELKREIESVSLRDKVNYDRSHYGIKNNYEERSYQRDSFVEGLKTVGAVSSVALAGILLFNKFNK